MANEKITDLETATSNLLEYLHETTYLLEHFIHKSNKTTSLEVRNNLRGFKDVASDFKAASILFFKDEETGVKNDG
jgi:hypothetical protein